MSRGGGVHSNLKLLRFQDTTSYPTRRKYPSGGINQVRPESKGTWGGRRQGAGRPAGSRNKARLISGLPATDDPLVWLLALMEHEPAPMRQRMAAAKVLLPYCHPLEIDTSPKR